VDETKRKIDSNTIIIVVTILVGALIIGGAIIAGEKNPSSPSGNGEPVVAGGGLDIGEAPVVGNADAPNTIVEFLDFQCPYCEQFATQIEPELRRLYIETGKAKFVYKALTFIDSYDRNQAPMESLLAAQAGECAKEQGKYAVMHDAIYTAEAREAAEGKNPENSGNLTEQFFADVARTNGFDVEAFSECVKSERVADVLKVYANDANAAMGGRVSTPTVFVNGVKVANPFDLAEYEKLIK
jgi:protein-disulfide isomerase